MPAGLIPLILSLIGGGLGSFGARKALGALAGRAAAPGALGAAGRFAGTKGGQLAGEFAGGFGGFGLAQTLLGGEDAGEPDLDRFNAQEDSRLDRVFQESQLRETLLELGIDLDDLNLQGQAGRLV